MYDLIGNNNKKRRVCFLFEKHTLLLFSYLVWWRNTPLLAALSLRAPSQEGNWLRRAVRNPAFALITHPDYAKPLVGPLCAARKEGENTFLLLSF